MNPILILGVGNILLTDEGVGIHAIFELEKEEWPAHVSLLDGEPPGTVSLLRPRRADEFPPLMSAHEIGLQDMVAVMVLTGKLPDIHLITVSVGNIDTVSIDLTPPVRESLPQVKALVRKLVKELSE